VGVGVVGVGLGLGIGDGVVHAVILTPLNVAVPSDAECEVTSSPASIAPLTLSVAEDPEMVFHEIPSAEVAAVKLFPVRTAIT
jgi:hypothetical protein